MFIQEKSPARYKLTIKYLFKKINNNAHNEQKGDMSYYHEDKKCKNCVLNGDCLIEDPEDCDEQEDED